MIFRFLLLAAACGCLFSCSPEPKILVFSKTAGFRHASIEAGVEAIRLLGARHSFEVEATEDSAFFTEENLRRFAAVVFLNTSGDVLNYHQQADFQRFIEAGGGFVGVHGAAATEYDWKWYGRLVGAYFSDHPEIQAAKVTVVDAKHGSTKHLPEVWEHTDEWYNFRPVPPADKVFVNTPPKKFKPTGADLDTLRHFDELAPTAVQFDFANGKTVGKNGGDGASPNIAKGETGSSNAAAQPASPPPGGTFFLEKNIQVLITLDENSYRGGKNGLPHPIAWRQDFEGGRSFYTGLGHTIESYSDENFLRHLLGGIRDAIGTGRLDYSKARTQRIPPEDRFVRTVLAENLDEPTELDVFPDGKVIFVERKGAIKIYDPATDTVETVCHFPVYHAEEEGLMGVALDPNWEKNKWIYLYYSLDEPALGLAGRRNRLSRFEFYDNMLHLATEKKLLEVPELYGCCHTGGSIAFDAKGNLFLSTGDNTNPFESDGYAPMDERPGRALWDAQKSSANANDLRGKILRITPQPDGTYTIPEGNLFPKGTPGTRPEIFVMGCRNPYRISVDSKTGCVFWGDVGPDAGKNGYWRGPKGYDTFNRACEPGNYGWPLFRGNHVYFDYDFSTKKTGALFDPLRPHNDSPNNTGIRELPPVQPPLIWYSYDESLEFPWVATGGKNPMAGPVFHAADFVPPNPSSAEALAELGFGGTFPEYFEDKLFIYEWMRNWIYIVTLDSAGNFVQADPFLPSQQFSRPMDMAFGKDGALYVLEYGTQWFAANPDARLNKIEYAPGNRKPVAHLHASKTFGAEPLAVHFFADSTLDYDHDSLTYHWSVEGTSFRTSGVKFDYTFRLPGKYEVVLKATDRHGATSRATRQIVVGNEPPSLGWEINGNQTFFWDNETLDYRLNASDREDGNLESGKLDTRRLKISMDYLAQGQDVAAIILGHQTQAAAGSLKFAKGKVLIDKNDCKTCHAEDRKVNGPSYVDIANRYYGNEFAEQTLRGKVIQGGAGNWGETAMSAHPNLTQAEASEIVKYILSLAGEVQVDHPLPWQGTYVTNAHLTEKSENQSTEGAYVFQASYRDAGRDGTNSLAAISTLLLRHPKIEAETFDRASKGVRKSRLNESDTMVVKDILSSRYLGFEKFDLTEVGTVELGFLEKPAAGWQVEVRLDSPDGELVGKAALSEKTQVALSGKNLAGVRPIYFVFRNAKLAEASLGGLDWVWFRRKTIQ